MSLYGSVTNRILENGNNEDLKVGNGATIYLWSDRNAYTIIEVISKCKAIIQRDKAIRVDTNGFGSENQEYKFERDTNGKIEEIYCRNGVWKTKEGKQKVRIGIRDEYYDFTF